MSFLLGGAQKDYTHPTQGGLLLKKFENHSLHQWLQCNTCDWQRCQPIIEKGGGEDISNLRKWERQCNFH